ncbi:flagellar assembly protein FliW [Brevibacillus sp. GCM10020057]|uniref:flagellar assembly protein FliW n=1 Tax=Brevibacillus sp. GCM10020057 TaxID=3317327 RepID=UPI003644FAB0
MQLASISEGTKLYFEDGIPGFPDLMFFQLQQQENDTPFYFLSSLENPAVEFGLINPFAIFPDYEFVLDDVIKEQLRVQDDTALMVVNIVTIRTEGEVTVNLKAPIVINIENRMAKQVILNDERYPIRQPLFQLQQKVDK